VSVTAPEKIWLSMTTHTHPDGTLVATAHLPDGRVLRVVGVQRRDFSYFAEDQQAVPGPCEELDHTLRWMGLR
jgi:hypothetical protein